MDGKVEHAESMYVVLYDVGAKRAWLVHGADALLHLSRAYLSSPHAPPAKHHFSAQLVERFVHRDVSKRQSARKILCRKRNRNIRVCPTDGSDSDSSVNDSLPAKQERNEMFFENLVSNFFEIMQEMQLHQNKIQEPQQWSIPIFKKRVTAPFTARLEGFGFADMMSLQSPVHPRYAELTVS